MRVNRIDDLSKLNSNELELVFLGDLHLGSKDCNLQAIKQEIARIKKKKNAIVIMMGDTVNCGLRNSVGAGSFDDVITPEAQIDLAIELLTPIKDKIYGLHNGNHGDRIYNETTMNPEKIIARALGVPHLGDSCFHHIRFGSQYYTIFTTHGNTCSTSVGGALTACMNLNDYAQADVYAMGHSHKLANYSQICFEVDNRNRTVFERKKFFILTGGYINWKDSYSEKKNYTPLKLGCANCILRGDRYECKVNT